MTHLPASKTAVINLGLIIVLVSVACNLPLNLAGGASPVEEGTVSQTEGEGGSIAQLATDTPIPTSTPTPLPTDTPVPTPTATLVVQPTPTKTAVPGSGAQGAAAPLAAGGGGDEATPVATSQAVAGPQNAIVNGDFEASWPDWQGLAPGWQPFDNGNAHVGWYKDTWDKAVYDGDQAQLIEIITDLGQGDRYAGIFQTVDVIAGAEYQLTIHGLVRSEEGSPQASNWGYRLQYGLDFNGGTDWTQVAEWVEMPFDDHPRTDPNAQNVYNYGTFTTKIVPTGHKLTLFIRAWQKFPTGLEGNYDVDGISLVGTGQTQPTTTPTATPTPPPAATTTPTPIPAMPDSGGELPDQGPSVVVIWLGGLLLLTLIIGALVGLVRRRI